LDKNGLCLFNHPVTATGDMDPNLIAGFIQANIAFSREGVANRPSKKNTKAGNDLSFAPLDSPGDELDLKTGNKVPDRAEIDQAQFLYELNYQNFVLLVHDSVKSRSVLILDHPASYSLRHMLVTFTGLFEKVFGGALDSFVGDVSIFEDARLLIDRVFETDLLLPYQTKFISPADEESLNDLERMAYRSGVEQTRKKGFFFISALVEDITGAIQKPAKDVLHAVYAVIKREFFIPQQVENAAKDIEELQAQRDQAAKERSSISTLTGGIDEAQAQKLKESIKSMSDKEARALIKKYMSTAAVRIESSIYDDAAKNYELAKIVATELGLSKELEQINAKIQDLNNTVIEFEYENSMKNAVTAEKNKEWLKAIQHYTTCRKILLGRLPPGMTDKQVQKLDERIRNLQGKIR
jgi:hypothetical protein